MKVKKILLKFNLNTIVAIKVKKRKTMKNRSFKFFKNTKKNNKKYTRIKLSKDFVVCIRTNRLAWFTCECKSSLAEA